MAHQVLWRQEGLEGCYLTNKVRPSRQQKFDPIDVQHVVLESGGSVYGIATLPNGERVGCETSSLRFVNHIENGVCIEDPENGMDVFIFSIAHDIITSAIDQDDLDDDSNRSWQELF